ncbi:hypothetical protein E0J16_30400 [Rhizobium pisi]|nr:hypothetical protein E0J16_30400 [Rhizobium pisi]
MNDLPLSDLDAFAAIARERGFRAAIIFCSGLSARAKTEERFCVSLAKLAAAICGNFSEGEWRAFLSSDGWRQSWPRTWSVTPASWRVTKRRPLL